MSMDAIIEREARLTVLKELKRQPNRAISSEAMRRFLLDFLLIDKPREWVEIQFRFLEAVGAVNVTEAGTVRIAQLTERGDLHLSSRIVIDGILPPSARPGG